MHWCSRLTLLAIVSLFVPVGQASQTAIGSVTIDSVLLESEATSGGKSDSFSETEFGFYNAISTFNIGLAEDYLASGVVQAEFTHAGLSQELYVQLDALASAVGTLTSSVTASAMIDFTTNTEHILSILDPPIGVFLSRISDAAPLELIDEWLLPAGSYRLSTSVNAFASGTDSEIIDAAFASITFRAVPEPASGALMMTFSVIVLHHHCRRRSTNNLT
ncbi:hypothetical protein [Bythopirellula polymerisocia]|uniref:PEP-CTERM protein-sorting domain-containing protein n=1 Tax=Bythopirellula polymerisocia TaxID=2528003 RepID=A0A5C6CW25_9BACT|nr:hypothetical protein [Bythopirellula polymerisocia]TWU27904.1 hypothetical protein Pla144_26830 [Bythopirellula polymerisocia]